MAVTSGAVQDLHFDDLVIPCESIVYMSSIDTPRRRVVIFWRQVFSRSFGCVSMGSAASVAHGTPTESPHTDDEERVPDLQVNGGDIFRFSGTLYSLHTRVYDSRLRYDRVVSTTRDLAHTLVDCTCIVDYFENKSGILRRAF